MTRLLTALVVLAAMLATAGRADAQSLGIFRWQLQPFCNAVVATVTQQGGQYTIDGYDDQCGAPQRAPLVGIATPNPDGTIGFGLNVVVVPGGRAVQIEARISPAGLSGPWSDSAGNSGTFAFGANTGGSPRPAPASGSAIPGTFSLLTDGGFVARGMFGTGTIPASNIGTRMMWHPKKAAFRAGHLTIPAWDDLNVGAYSTAFGLNTLASGISSSAFGEESQATGLRSSAFGYNSSASGEQSFATGYFSSATAFASIAMGRNALAFGAYSAAFGTDNIASGTASVAFGVGNAAPGAAAIVAGQTSLANGGHSVAMGLRVSAGGDGSVVLGSDATAQAAAPGTFIFGDRSTTNDITGFVPNQFLVRAANGVGIYTNATLTAGVELSPGDSSWNVVSDVNMKEAFRDLAGEDVLTKLSSMPVREWSYKAQGEGVRHVGPTAQDFHAAFGLGTNPLRINTVDADGIALAGVKALEARTRAINAKLMRENDELRARLTRLEQLVERK